jgi:4-nitrophenyl phosphatase
VTLPADHYRAFLLDLDGVLYRGDEVVSGAPGAVSALRERGRTIVFMTNNSARTPDQVARKLRGLGIEASADEVVTSAQATATMLAHRAAEDGRPSSAFVIGERGLRQALEAAGIAVVDGDRGEAGFVVVGWDRSVDYAKLRTATVLVGRGALLVATNQDPAYPAPGGELWPGAGALLAAVETASGARATAVVGKPHRPLFEAAVDRAGAGPALVVGDRLETDVAGALAAGLDAALVLTGAASAGDLLDQDALPTMVLSDLHGLLADRPVPLVRAARPEDGPKVRALLERSGLAAEAADADQAVVLGDGELLATAAAAVRGEQAYLHSVAVDEDRRARHLGTLAVAAAVRRAVREGAREVLLLTEEAEDFFARLGFDRIERDRLPSWVADRSTACSASAVVMRRDARPTAQ